MYFEQKLTTGKLLKRYKRFLADVKLDNGEIVVAHVPNTGSMRSTNTFESPVALSYHPQEHRKLKWTLELIQAEGCWVGVNTMRTNKIVEEAISKDLIEPLRGYESVKREVKYGKNSRVDLLLQSAENLCYVEIKNVTYKKGNGAFFPDAVTTRGAKHLKELMNMVKQGHRAVIFFLVNRNDCISMSPEKNIDPNYAQLLTEATDFGVEAMAYTSANDPLKTMIDNKIPVITL